MWICMRRECRTLWLLISREQTDPPFFRMSAGVCVMCVVSTLNHFKYHICMCHGPCADLKCETCAARKRNSISDKSKPWNSQITLRAISCCLRPSHTIILIVSAPRWQSASKSHKWTLSVWQSCIWLQFAFQHRQSNGSTKNSNRTNHKWFSRQITDSAEFFF